MYFHFYPATVNSKRPAGTIDLKGFVNANKNPSDKIKEVFRQIAAAEAIRDDAAKAKLKQENLFYFTPCVYTDGLGRGYANIKLFNGVAVLDFDHIENAESFKHFIFENYLSVICSYLSPSKKGVKVLVKIPVVNSVDEFKEYYFGLGTEFEKFNGFDGTGQNCVLPLFLSYDPDLLYRENAVEWNKKGKMLNAFKASDLPAVQIVTDDAQKARVFENIKKAIDAINDNGHPQVRAAGVSLGGYVASGYLDSLEAVSFIASLIASNSYLSKGVDGYIKTAKTAIDAGSKSQLLLK
jgi:hypothetical protein